MWQQKYAGVRSLPVQGIWLQLNLDQREWQLVDVAVWSVTSKMISLIQLVKRPGNDSVLLVWPFFLTTDLDNDRNCCSPNSIARPSYSAKIKMISLVIGERHPCRSRTTFVLVKAVSLRGIMHMSHLATVAKALVVTYLKE
jgi:hypothetical protein